MDSEIPLRNVEIISEVSPYEIINALMEHLTRDELVVFIETLDDSVGDWSFTEKLHEYFQSQMILLRADDE